MNLQIKTMALGNIDLLLNTPEHAALTKKALAIKDERCGKLVFYTVGLGKQGLTLHEIKNEILAETMDGVEWAKAFAVRLDNIDPNNVEQMKEAKEKVLGVIRTLTQ
jgi:uncharacterized protein YlaN (UPF0358 family)